MNFCLTMSPDTLRMRHGNIELVAAIYKKKAYDCDLYACINGSTNLSFVRFHKSA